MVTGKWDCVILREICESVNYGYTARAKPEPIGPKFLRITDIMPDRINWASVPYCKIDDKKLSKYQLKKGDIVIARTGTPGYAKRIKANHYAVFASYLVRIRVNPKYDNRYIGFVIESDEYKRFVELNRGGAAQPHANAQILTSFPVPLPPLPTQRKIAAVLSAYDDLIENNTRRIKILEDMAQTLYREWFVHFRFPGHENVPMVDSPLGPLPQGWEVKRLDEVAQLHRGRSYRSVNLVDDGEGLPFLNLKNINREGGFRSNGLKWYEGEFKETQVATPNDIIMALTDMTQDRKVVARSARVPDLNHKKYVFSMDLLKIKPRKQFSKDFLYGVLRYSNFAERLKEYANGTTVLHLSPSHVHLCELVLPPSELRQSYADIAKAICQQNDLLEKKNTNLRQTRDLLIPKLISGEIDVSELDIDTNGMQPAKSKTHIPYPLTERLQADEKILGGKPVIRGTRLAVSFILDLLKQGWSEEDIVENYPSVVHADIEACRTYQEEVNVSELDIDAYSESR